MFVAGVFSEADPSSIVSDSEAEPSEEGEPPHELSVKLKRKMTAMMM